MTTINVAVFDEFILMSNDGLATGRKPQKYAKMTPLPHLGAILASRGQFQIATNIPFLACQFETLSEMRDGLAALLKKKYGLARRFMPSFFTFDVVVAGFHEGKPLAFSISSKTWQTDPIEDGFVSPAVNLDGLPEARGSIEAAATVKLREVMRRQRAEFGDAGCGGFGQLTSVLSNGTIITRKLCDF